MDFVVDRQGTTRHPGVVIALAALLPVGVCALLTTVRTEIATANAALILVLVGIGVTEIALWGRRQRGRAARQQGYLAGVLQTVESVAVGTVEPRKLADEVADQVTRDGRTLDVGRHGLPTDSEVELVVQTAGEVQGTYLITSATRIVRPTAEQLGVDGERHPREGAGRVPRAD